MTRGISTPVAAALLISAAASLSAQQPTYETTRIADGVYQFRYQGHNGFFIVTGDGVVAVDPISTQAARAYAAEIRKVAPDAPLRAIVYSHRDADHATGAAVLRDEFGGAVPVIAHANARAPLVAAADPDLPPPDVTFADRMSLHLGGREISLRYLGRSHSDDMVVVHLPAERIIFAVDFLNNDRVGYRDLPGWIFPDVFDTVRRVQELDYGTVVFGHGPPGDRATIDRQIRYYHDLRDAVAAALQRGATEDEAARSVALPDYQDWGGYADWFQLNVRAVYRWLASERR